MPTAKNTASKTSASKTAQPKNVAPSKRAQASAQDAIKLLTDDHKEVKSLFEEYAALVEADGGEEERQALALSICTMLTVHATVEEELFYPAAREALGEDEDLVNEADVEHASAKELIAQIRGSQPDDGHYNAMVKVLGEYIEHHVKEEEGEIFPKVKKAGLDTKSLGPQLAHRKEELMAELESDAEA